MDTQLHIPTLQEFVSGISAYYERESRAYVYFEALDKLTAEGEEPQSMTTTVYRFGMIELKRLRVCMTCALGNIAIKITGLLPHHTLVSFRAFAASVLPARTQRINEGSSWIIVSSQLRINAAAPFEDWLATVNG